MTGDGDPEMTAALLAEILASGTVERFDVLHEALIAAEERGAARERAAHLSPHLRNVTIIRTDQ